MPHKALTEFIQSPDMPDLTNFVTTQEAAALLGYHVDYIRQLIRKKALDSMRVGNMIFVSKESIERYKQEKNPPGRPKGKWNE